MSEPIKFNEMSDYRRAQTGSRCRDARLVDYYRHNLFDILCSHYRFDGFVPTWDTHYFQTGLFHNGFICFIDTPDFGVIPQRCTLSGYNVFRAPSRVLVANPYIEKREYDIGVDTEIVWLNNQREGADYIIDFYANLMALTVQTYSINQINSRRAGVFNVENKQQAETMKKMYDGMVSGESAVFVTYGTKAGKPWEFFADSSQYIGNTLLNDLKTIEDRFLTEIGVNNANTQKKERMVTNEVDANNQSINERSNAWLECMQSGLDKVNDMFGTALSVSVRADAETGETGAETDGEGVNNEFNS